MGRRKVRNDSYRIQEGLKEAPVLYLRKVRLVQHHDDGNYLILRPVHSECRSGQPSRLGGVLPSGFRLQFQLQSNLLPIFKREENPGFENAGSDCDPR